MSKRKYMYVCVSVNNFDDSKTEFKLDIYFLGHVLFVRLKKKS